MYNPHTERCRSAHTRTHTITPTHGSAICGLSLVVVRQHDEVCRDWRRKESASCAVMCDRRYQRTGAGSTVTDSHHTSWHQPGSCVQQIWVSGGWRCVGSSPPCVCTSFSCFFFVCVCVCLFMCLSACVCTIWFLKAKRWLPRWSWAARTRVVLRQRAGNLNLHNPCLQLPDLLPQEPGLVLHALHFFPHPAEHYHYNNLHSRNPSP